MSAPLHHRLKPAARARAHLLAAAVLWTVVGAGLAAAGGYWCAAIDLPWTPVVAAAAVALGFAKAALVLRPAARRNAARIEARGDGRCLGGFVSWRTWLLIAGMMAAGQLLRRSPVPRPLLGFVYTAVGTGLLGGSGPLWRRFRDLGPRAGRAASPHVSAP